jgi:hypothetical protein
MARERLVYAFHDKTRYVFERAERCGHSHLADRSHAKLLDRHLAPSLCIKWRA